ncbi:MAG: alpha-2,8-polysialyltransferase family protein [Bacteroides fragilis]|nr:alpha-2,8-polysialyltransferase family protein [Bacteroides fragilis]
MEVEEEQNLFDLEYHGLRIWPHLRFHFWSEIKQEKWGLLPSQRSQKPGFPEIIPIGFSWLYHSYFKKQSIREGTDILFYTHPRRIMIDGKYECCYTSALRAAFPNSMMVEVPEGYSRLTPAREKDIYYLDRIKLESNVSWHIFKTNKKAYQKLKHEIADILNPVIAYFESAYEVELDHEKMISLSVQQIYITLKKRPKIINLLNQINPKLIIEVVSYSQYTMTLNEWGKDHGVPTIELQHGVMGSENLPYNRITRKPFKQFPDYVFVYSDFWKKTTRFPISEDHIKVVGFPYFERMLNKYKSIEQTKAIVFISQGEIGQILSQVAVETYNLLANTGWKIYYKLHPSEFADWRDAYPELAHCPQIEVIDTKEIHLYELLARCKVQVGVSSTAIFEGFGFGLSTFIYRGYRSEIFTDLAEQGFVTYVENANSLVDEILNLKESTRCSTPVETFWGKNALENMKQEIAKIQNL